MRLLVLVLFGVPLAAATIAVAARGNPFAIGIALGVGGPACFIVAVAIVDYLVDRPTMKASPHKDIERENARLERDLRIGPWADMDSREAPKGCTDPDCPHEHYMVDGGARFCLPSEAPTTVARGEE